MYYETRNLATLATLGTNTRIASEKLYAYAKEIGFNILIYEGIRTLEQQKKNVANGKSQTLKSYHIVGQAFDYVPVDAKGNTLWSVNAYVSTKGLLFIKKAKSLGFTWGGDWNNNGDWRDETFLDSPHMQYNYKGYGTDTLNGKTPTAPTTPKAYLGKGDRGAEVTKLQTDLKYLGYSLAVDGIFGDGTLVAVKAFQKAYGLAVDGYFGSKSQTTIAKAVADKKEKEKPVKPTPTPSTPSTIKSVGKIKVDKVTNFTYVYAKADDKSTIIQQAIKNSTFNISGSVVGWYEVIINNKRYYIKSKYCSKI